MERRVLLGVPFLAFPLSAQPEHEWRWVRVLNNASTGWDIETGRADVDIREGKVTATFFWAGSRTDVRLVLQGSIRGNQLKLKETFEESDYTGSVYTGTRTVKRWTGMPDSTGIETINLSDTLGMIGITRTLLK